MPAIDINLDGDNAWPDLVERRGDIVHARDVTWKLALKGGMSSGAPSLVLRLDLGPALRGSQIVIAETSLAAWIAATCALRGRFPEAFRDTPLEAPMTATTDDRRTSLDDP